MSCLVCTSPCAVRLWPIEHHADTTGRVRCVAAPARRRCPRCALSSSATIRVLHQAASGRYRFRFHLQTGRSSRRIGMFFIFEPGHKFLHAHPHPCTKQSQTSSRQRVFRRWPQRRWGFHVFSNVARHRPAEMDTDLLVREKQQGSAEGGSTRFFPAAFTAKIFLWERKTRALSFE